MSSMREADLNARAVPRTREPPHNAEAGHQRADGSRVRPGLVGRRQAGRQGPPAAAVVQRHRRQRRTGRAVHARDGRRRNHHLRRSRRRRLASAEVSLSPIDGGALGRGACATSSATRGSTSPASPGAAPSPSNSRTMNRGLCRRLILAATAAGGLMAPGKPSVLLKMASPRRYLDPGLSAFDRGRNLWRKLPPRSGPRARARREHEGARPTSAISISFSRSPGGPASSGSTRSSSRRWS